MNRKWETTVIDEDPDWDEFVRLIETRPNIRLVELDAIGMRVYVVSIEED